MMHTMKRSGHLWIMLAGAAVLIAGHGAVLYYVSSHLALSVAAIAGLIAVVIVKHLGLLGPMYALVRKALRRPE